MRYLIICCFASFLSLISFRSVQSFTVNGKVVDAKSGVPIPGTTIRIKGENTGTSSAYDGTFSIVVPAENTELTISSVGFAMQNVKVKNDNKELIIKLTLAESKLEEVVVTGYSSSAKKDVTGVINFRRDQSNNIPPQIQLRGMVAGVTIRSAKTIPLQDANSTLFNRNNSDFNTEQYDDIVENRFLTATDNPLSTFSIDVDGASYSNVRRILQQGQLPTPGAVRIEEFINYFHYNYPQPTGDDPFSINTEIADCPWSPQHKLVMIGLQGKKIPTENLPASNLVFLIDVSGSMFEPDKLPLVKASMKLLVDQLREQDKVSLVAYAGNAGLVLPSTSGSQKEKIKDAIEQLEAGGSTAGGAGIQLAYKIATENFIKGGNNRVILCTDGDFNVGPSSNSELEKIIEEERKTGVYLTVLGYGTGNYSDSRMQQLADKGNGNHSYIDNFSEAKKVLVNEFGGTLFTIAKDVKLQVEFNPSKVQAYRLIGYENRLLNKEDFNNDKKDAGDLGSGHTVTALYEIIPAGLKNDFIESVDKLKYQQKEKPAGSSLTQEIMTIKFRYKKPDKDKSKLIEHAVIDQHLAINNTSDNFRFVAAVAQFGMLLRNSEFKQNSSFDNAWKLAKGSLGNDDEGYRSEFLKLLKSAQLLAKNNKNVEEENDDKEVGKR